MRPSISNAVNQFISQPCQPHLSVVHRITRYLVELNLLVSSFPPLLSIIFRHMQMLIGLDALIQDLKQDGVCFGFIS